jgi:hypothetical protein
VARGGVSLALSASSAVSHQARAISAASRTFVNPFFFLGARRRRCPADSAHGASPVSFPEDASKPASDLLAIHYRPSRRETLNFESTSLVDLQRIKTCVLQTSFISTATLPSNQPPHSIQIMQFQLFVFAALATFALATPTAEKRQSHSSCVSIWLSS